jgi:hypothetical protein
MWGETSLDLLSTVKVFLHDSQHPKLQKYAVQIFQLLVRIDTDAVWYDKEAINVH